MKLSMNRNIHHLTGLHFKHAILELLLVSSESVSTVWTHFKSELLPLRFVYSGY